MHKKKAKAIHIPGTAGSGGVAIKHNNTQHNKSTEHNRTQLRDLFEARHEHSYKTPKKALLTDSLGIFLLGVT
jgi:hypothetical protein